MNAIALVRHANHDPVPVKGPATVHPDTGQLLTKVILKAHAVGRSRVHLDMRIDGEPAVDSAAQNVFRLAGVNEPLERALYLYGVLEHDWVGLYMVYEAIRAGEGNGPALEAERNRIDAFKGTANSYKALGKDARHGSTKSGYPKPKITLEESRELIQGLLEGWIDRLNAKSP